MYIYTHTIHLHITTVKGNYKNNAIYICIKKNKVLKNFLNQGGERLVQCNSPERI